MQLRMTYPGRSIVWLETALSRDGILQTRAQSTMHVINGGFQEAEHPLLLRAVEPQATGDEVAWELVVSASGSISTFTARSGEPEKVVWSMLGLPALDTVGPMTPKSFEVLSGKGADGALWKLTLKFKVEPLMPSVLGDGLVAGFGQDWATTAKGLKEPE